MVQKRHLSNAPSLSSVLQGRIHGARLPTWGLNMHKEKNVFLNILFMVIFFFCAQKCIYRIRFQEIKTRPSGDFELGPFFSLFLMRNRLSSGQKWLLRAYLPLISLYSEVVLDFPHSRFGHFQCLKGKSKTTCQ